MRRTLRTCVLACAIGGVVTFPTRSFAQPAPAAEQPAPAAPAAAAATTQAQAAVPVKVVVLFSSGVGYFQHAGTLKGDADTELRFKSAQINDVLKSLVLDDGGKGSVSGVTYPSQDPLDKTLKSFQVDITANPSLADLLNQLRGAKVTVVLSTEQPTGTVLGVEKRQKPVGDKGQPIDVSVLNLFSGASIRSIDLTEIRDLKLDDPTLQDELSKALAALSSARDQDKKPVTIHFRGAGERDVRIGYVVETPIWKTSYRLMLDPMPGNGPATQPAADANKGGTGGKLQGWAIVENQTDNDWDDVELSLVSGRPISFIEDLYQPLYIPRPVVVPELYASLIPRTYEAGNNAAMPAAPFGAAAAAAANGQVAGKVAQLQQDAMARRSISLGELASSAAPLDPTRSIQSVASAGKVGELFQYTVGSVTLPRQKSAMIPIVTDPIEVERLSIYNESVMPRNPLNGARVKNTTGKHLLTGPITVIDGNTYAGDAQIDNLPPNQERLISYGVDLQMLVDAKSGDATDELLTGKIVKGVLSLTHKFVRAKAYEAQNKSDHDKTLVIEHPFEQGWDLVDTIKPEEKTDALYRFRGVVKAGQASKLVVKEQSVQDQAVALLQTDLDGLVAFSSNGKLPDDVRKAVDKAAGMKRDIADSEKRLAEDAQQVNDVVQDQHRINETLRTIDKGSQLYSRLLNTLNDQETQLEKLRGEIKDLTKTRDRQQKDLTDYLGGLDVG